MKNYKDLVTGEFWSEEELRKLFEQFRDDDAIYDEFDEFVGYRHESFEDYLDEMIVLGRHRQGGLAQIWYAIQKTSEDEWGYGSYDLDEAKEMLREQGYGQIAVIDESDAYCIEEIRYEDLD